MFPSPRFQPLRHTAYISSHFCVNAFLSLSLSLSFSLSPQTRRVSSLSPRGNVTARRPGPVPLAITDAARLARQYERDDLKGRRDCGPPERITIRRHCAPTTTVPAAQCAPPISRLRSTASLAPSVLSKTTMIEPERDTVYPARRAWATGLWRRPDG